MSADNAEEVLQQILSQEYRWEDGEDYTSWTVVSGGPADTLRAALASLPVVSPRVACVLLRENDSRTWRIRTCCTVRHCECIRCSLLQDTAVQEIWEGVEKVWQLAELEGCRGDLWADYISLLSKLVSMELWNFCLPLLEVLGVLACRVIWSVPC